MKVSELVAELTTLAEVHGDLDVIVYDSVRGEDCTDLSIEYNADQEPPVIAVVIGDE